MFRRIPRRSFLTGAGALIALPWLDAMAPKKAHAAAADPKRLGIFYFPFGTHQRAWDPATAGTAYTMPTNLSALTPHRSRVVLTKGLGAHGLTQGSHMASVPHFTTEAVPDCVFRVRTKSADMIISDHLRQTNPSLGPLITRPSVAYGFSGCYPHGGTTWEASIGTYLSWTGETTGASQRRTPQAVFDWLFTNRSPSAMADPMVAYRRARGLSVLDSVLGQANALKATVGTSDRQKLDQYYTSIREIERGINASIPPPAPSCLEPARPGTLTFEDEARMFIDLAVLAMACDRSRVVTHLFDSEGENHRAFPALNVDSTVGHHLLSHWNSNEGGMPAADKPAPYLRITAWYAQQLAYLITKMASYAEGDHDLLYNSVIVFGSGMGDGKNHDQLNLPVVLAGELGGTITTGRAIDASGTRMANLWLAIMQRFGLQATSYASSTGALAL